MISNVEMLLDKGAKAIVIACNTATAASVGTLREKYKDLNIIGIEPAIKPTVKYKEHSNVLVMATELTLKQEKFNELLNRFSDEVNIKTLPCPGLVELIEEGKTDGEELEALLKKLLKPVDGVKFDSVVLGCTHYPHIKAAIRKILGAEVMFFDGGEGTARETMRRLKESDLINNSSEKGYLKIISSTGEDSFERLSKYLLEK